MKTTVAVPSSAVTSGALPHFGICPRHGLPAVRSKKRSYYTPTPLWAWVLLLLSLLVAIIIMLVIRKTVAGPVPECATCVSEQKKRLPLVLVCTIGGVLVFFALAATNSTGAAVAGSSSCSSASSRASSFRSGGSRAA